MAFVVGLSGGSCSGKSTFSRLLRDALRPASAVELPFDAYYRPLAHLSHAERQAVNFDHPDSLDHELYAAHLGELRALRRVERPDYDFALHLRRPEGEWAEPADVVVADGILVLAIEPVRVQLDLAVFLDVPTEVRLARRLHRDTRERGRTEESVRSQFRATVEPMHQAFVQPSSAHADVVVRHGDDYPAVARALAERIRTGL